MGSRETNDTASDTSTSVTCLGGLFVTTLTEVIGLGVADAGATNDRVLTVDHDHMVLHVELGDTVGTSLNIAQVTNVSNFSVGATMNNTVRVEVGTSSLAAFNEVTYRKSKNINNVWF